jgi:tRNA 2-thiocytidine biosynthesis protein TtcA
VPERDIGRYARARAFPIIPCRLCGSQPNLQRKAIARMLTEWDRQSPGRVDAIFTAICNVGVSHLADPAAFDFAGLRVDEASDPAAGRPEPAVRPLRAGARQSGLPS